MDIGRAQFGPVRIAWTDAADAPPTGPSVWARLGEQQARRYAALTGHAAQRFGVGRALLARVIAELTNSDDLGFTTTCKRCGADHGRPRLERAAVAVSLSYAGSMVAVAAAHTERTHTVGVDIERVPPSGASEPLPQLANLFAPAGPPDLTRWTLLEAAAKADGRGIRIDLSRVEVGERGTGDVPGSRAVYLPEGTGATNAGVIAGPEGFVMSAAVRFAQETRSEHGFLQRRRP